MEIGKVKRIFGVTLGAVLAISSVGAFAACEMIESDEEGVAALSSSEIVVSTSGDSVNVNVNVDMQGAYDLFHNHVYTSVPMSGAEPTCTKDGYGYYTCECGAQYSDVIPALGHDLYITEDGLYRCSTCGIIFSVVNDDGHEYSSEAIYVPEGDEEGAKWVTYCIDSDCKYIKELDESELSGYTRVVTAAEAFGDVEKAGETSYGQSSSDTYRVVESGKYVVKKDIVTSLKIAKGAKVEIDLCGKSISPKGAKHTMFVLPAASLVITDSSSSKAGTIYAGETGAALYNKEGDVVISSGRVAREGEEVEITGEGDEKTGNVNCEGRVFGVIENKGEMTIESGVTVSATYVAKGTYTWEENTFDESGRQIFDDDGTPVKQTFSEEYEETRLLSDRPLIVNGYIDDKACDEYMERGVGAHLEIEGGTFNGGTYIENEILARLNISGNGKFTCTGGCIRSYGDLNISGGKFNTTNGNIIEICNDSETAEIVGENSYNPVVYISGGTFYAAMNGSTFAVTTDESYSSNGTEICIDGGVFRGGFSLAKDGNAGYIFGSLEICSGEFASWPGTHDDNAYTYEFLASGSAVEKDSDGIYTVRAQAADHEHNYEAATWTWANDASSCEVTLICNTPFCARKIVGPIDATVSSVTETISATCEKNEITRYTATCAYGGETFRGTYDIETEGTKLPHNYTENSITMSWTYIIISRSASGTFVCTECGNVEESGSISPTQSGDTYIAEYEAGDGNTYWWSGTSSLTDWGVIVDGEYVSHVEYFAGNEDG